MKLIIIVLFIIVMVVLVVFLMVRNQKDEKEVAEKLRLQNSFAGVSRTESGKKDFRHDGKRAD